MPRPQVLPLILAVCVAVATGAFAQLPTASRTVDAAGLRRDDLQAVTQVEGITEHRLPNGLQVLLVPDASKPSTTVNLTFRVGSRHENQGETGMAHLLEHLIFKGTPTTRNVQAEMAKRGLRYNGSTSQDRTNYFASFTASDASDSNLRWFLAWSADAMVNSFIAKADLDSEMTVVRNEMEAGENNPGRVLFQRLLSTMYDWHPYAHSPIGARSDVENVSIERLQAFYRKHYQPDNATLIVAGRFDATQVLAWVVESYGPIPRPARVLDAAYTLDPVQDGERQVTVRRVGGTGAVYLGFHVPPGAHPDFAAVSLLAQVLGDTPGGRLHKRLVERKLAAGVFGAPLAQTDPGVLLLGAQLAPGQDLDRARAEMAAVVDGLAREPVTAQELERARTQWLNGWEQAFSDAEQVGVGLSEAIALGDWRLFFLQRDQVKRVTLAELQRVAVAYLRPDNRSVALYRPVAAPQRAPAPARVDVAALLQDFRGSAAAAAAEAFDPSPANLDAKLQTQQLPGGLRVALLPKAARGGAVQARLALHFGTLASVSGQSTVAGLLGAVIDKGVAAGPGGPALTRQQLSDRFDALRAEVSFGAAEQSLDVSITTVREHLPAVIELVGRVLRSPALPADALEEARRAGLAGLARQREEPAARASNALDRLGNPYPPGDPRHEPSFDEVERSLKTVTAGQLRAFHGRHLSAATAEFAAVGDFDAAAVQRALQSAFGGWRQPAAGPLPYQRVPRPLVEVPAQRLVLAAPDKANASGLAVLALPVNDTHPDYAALMVANHVFGSGGSSLLWKRIRETEGLSYGVGSDLQWGQEDLHSRWVFSAIFAPQNQAKVEAAFREELARSLRDGFTSQEVDAARTALLNLRRLSRAQDANLAAQAAGNLHLGRRFALSQATDEKLAALTPEQVNAAWRRHIDPARIASAWAGDFKAAP